MLKFVNNAATTLAAPFTVPTLTAGQNVTTQVLIAPGDHSKFTPAAGFGSDMGVDDFVVVTIEKADGTARVAIRVQGVSASQAWSTGSGTVTASALHANILAEQIEGAAGGTVFPAGSKVEARLTAATADGFLHASKSSAAMGRGAVSLGPGGMALGAYAKAGASSFAAGVGAVALGSNALALGGHAPNFIDRGLTVGCVPLTTRDDWWLEGSVADYAALPAVVCSPFVDLGQAPAWAANVVYQDGDVVRPTAGGALQFALWDGEFGYGVTNEVTSGATEPGWPTAAGGSVAADGTGNSYWLAMNLSAGVSLEIPAGTVFFADEVGFVCYKYANVTTAPFVSVGSDASPTAWASNVQLSQISGAMQRHRITAPGPAGLTGRLRFKVATPAAGTSSQFHGRFYVRGHFLMLQG